MGKQAFEIEIKDMQEVEGIISEGMDEVKEFWQHKTWEARDWLGTDEVEELKRELKEHRRPLSN